MIAFIQGELCDIEKDSVVVACQGIGYEIQVPGSVISRLPAVGMAVKLFTYTYVREDALGLFGFLNRDDLAVFKQLITVSGVGPKGALAILSVMSADELRMAILAEDAKTLSKAPGIGAKTARRMILDLKDKLELVPMMEGDGNGGSASVARQDQETTDMVAREEVLMALIALGYSQTEAARAVRSVQYGENMDSETLLKQALKKIMVF